MHRGKAHDASSKNMVWKAPIYVKRRGAIKKDPCKTKEATICITFRQSSTISNHHRSLQEMPNCTKCPIKIDLLINKISCLSSIAMLLDNKRERFSVPSLRCNIFFFFLSQKQTELWTNYANIDFHFQLLSFVHAAFSCSVALFIQHTVRIVHHIHWKPKLECS